MKDRIEQIALECGIKFDKKWGTCCTGNVQIEKFANAISNEALELAARKLDDNWYKTQSDAAASIRKLKVE